MTALFKKC